MNRVLILCSFFFCFSLNVQSSVNVDNVIVVDGEENYIFSVENGKTVVRATEKKVYKAARMRDRVRVATFYGDYISIDQAFSTGWGDAQYSSCIPRNVFFDDTRMCYFDLDFEKKDDVIEVTFQRTFHDFRYFNAIFLSDNFFTRRKIVKFVIPKDINIKLINCNLTPNITVETQTDRDGTTSYIYSVVNQRVIEKEKNMLGYAYIYPHILISGAFKDYHEFYFWCHHLTICPDDIEPVRAKADEIVQGCTSDIEKIRRLYAWTQENIRYIAFEAGISGHKPEQPSIVLKKRYGDCKGKAVLLKALLRSQGFDARLTWIGTSDIAFDFTELPSLASGNHMICTLFFEGETYYLDPTAQYYPFGVIPENIRNRQVLIENGDSCIVSRTPLADAGQNTDSIHYEYEIVDDVLKGSGDRSWSGDAKDYNLNKYYSFTADQRESALQEFLTGGLPTYKIYQVQLFGNEPYSNTMNLSFQLENSGGCLRSGNEYYIELTPCIDEFLRPIDTMKRQQDVLWPFRYNSVCEVLLKIPDGYKVDYLPVPFSSADERVFLETGYSIAGNKVIYRRTVKLLDPLVKKSDFELWNGRLLKFMEACSERIILSKD